MTKRAKNIILMLSFAAFFVFSYLTVIYAYGYKFDFKDLKWEKTGGVLVRANAGGARVLIDGQPKGSTSFITASFAEKSLLPGPYDLRIEKDGFAAIFKSVEVRSGQVSQLAHLYFPKKEEIEKFIENSDLKNGNEPSSYFVSQIDGLVYRENGEEAEKISSEPVYIKDFVLRVLKNIVYLASKDAQAFGVFMLSNEGEWDNIYGRPATDVILSPDGKKLAIVGLNQINVLWLEDENEPPYYRQGHNEVILRTGEAIELALWFKTSWHLIYITAGQTRFLDLDPTGGRNDFLI